MDKREARKQFKSKITPRGIFVIRCVASGQTWLGPATHLDSEQNGTWFQLRNGMCRNSRMQAAWNAHGEAAFTYETFAERLKIWEGEVVETKLWGRPLACGGLSGRLFPCTNRSPSRKSGATGPAQTGGLPHDL